jgi:hypothetical protein
MSNGIRIGNREIVVSCEKLYKSPKGGFGMTLHLAIDDNLAEEVRKVADSRGMSIDQLVQELLERLTSQQSLDEEMEELRRLSGKGDSRGWKFNRDEIYERR